MEQKIIYLIQKLIPYIFWYFDHYLQNEDLDEAAPDFHHTNPNEDVKEIFYTKIPDYTITVKGIEIIIKCDGMSLSGTPAGYLSLIGGLWGIARGKILNQTPHIKLLYETGVMFPTGDFLIQKSVKKFNKLFVDIACDLKQKGGEYGEEADIILYQIIAKAMQYGHIDKNFEPYKNKLSQYFNNSQFEQYTMILDVPETKTSTNQGKIKKLAVSTYLTSKNLFHRLSVIEILHGCIHGFTYWSGYC